MTAPLFLFAHGAGAGSQSEWMKAWAHRLQQIGTVHRFDYPYMKAEGRRPPDRLPKLIVAHKEELSRVREGHNGPVILVGKSMGSRVGCHVSLEVPVHAVICFGYPLQSAGKKRTLRDAVLRQLTCPTLLIQGTRDPLCPLEILNELEPSFPECVTHHVVPAGDHSLLLRKKDQKQLGYDQSASDDMIMARLKGFITELPSHCF